MATAAFGTPGGVGYVDPFAPKPVAPSIPTPAPAPATTPTKVAAPVTVPPSTYTGPINNSINNTQQGTDLVNANRDQAAKMGITIPGATPTTPSAQMTTPPTTGTTGTTPTTTSTYTPPTDGNFDTSYQTDAAAQQQQQSYNAGIGVQQAQAFAKQQQDIQSGAIPLSTAENAQITALQNQFQQMIDKQTLINTGANGVAQMRGFQGGNIAGENPLFYANMVSAVSSAGVQKVTEIQTQMAAAVASLTQSFKDHDILAAKNAYDTLKESEKNFADTLQQHIKDTQDAIQKAADAQQKEQQYNLDVAKFNQTGDQNSFDNALKTEQQKFDEYYKQKSLALEQFKAGQGAGGSGVGVSQSAQLTGTGGVDPASQQAVLDQISAQYGPMTAVAIKSLANYDMNPTDWSSRTGGKGMTREQAVTLAKMYDPTYTDTNYPIRAAYLKGLTSNQAGTIGSAVNAANKSINHLTSYVNTMTDVNKMGMGTQALGAVVPLLGGFGRQSTTVNALENKLTLNPTQRTNISKATTEGLGVAEELAKFFKGTGATSQTEIDSWREQVSANSSPAAVRGSAQAAIDLLQGQLEVLTEQYTQTMGKPPESDFLNDSARASLANLKNQGYKVDIQGVLFTDVNAYLKNDPGAADNLKAAYQTLQTAGLPTTPENVLQMAQSL